MKILFITPHLSTGGGPQYLLNKNNQYINSPLYQKMNRKAEGGLASLTKRQMAKA
jgi:hypothetical protein